MCAKIHHPSTSGRDRQLFGKHNTVAVVTTSARVRIVNQTTHTHTHANILQREAGWMGGWISTIIVVCLHAIFAQRLSSTSNRAAAVIWFDDWLQKRGEPHGRLIEMTGDGSVLFSVRNQHSQRSNSWQIIQMCVYIDPPSRCNKSHPDKYMRAVALSVRDLKMGQTPPSVSAGRCCNRCACRIVDNMLCLVRRSTTTSTTSCTLCVRFHCALAFRTSGLTRPRGVTAFTHKHHVTANTQ